MISDDGFEMGRVTVSGTAQLLLSTCQFGLIGALIYVGLRHLAIGPRWVRVASLTAGGTVVFGALIIHDGVDFTLLEPSWLPIVLFLAIPLLYIPALALLTEHWERPDGWFATADVRRVGAVLVLWVATGVLLPLVALLLGAALLVRLVVDRLSPAFRSIVAWAARGVLGFVGVVALMDLVADLGTYA